MSTVSWSCWWPLSSAIPLPPMTENPKRETILGLGIPDYICRSYLPVLEIKAHGPWGTFSFVPQLQSISVEGQLKRYISKVSDNHWNNIAFSIKTSSYRPNWLEFRSLSVIREIIDGNQFSNNCIRKTFKFEYSWKNCTTLPWLTSHSISYLGSRINNALHYIISN